jgi:hypothetical protein
MPLYPDVHTIAGGVGAEDVAGAHRADVQGAGMHRRARGLVADEAFQLQAGS